MARNSKTNFIFILNVALKMDSLLFFYYVIDAYCFYWRSIGKDLCGNGGTSFTGSKYLLKIDFDIMLFI
jgi:hypothetical protein